MRKHIGAAVLILFTLYAFFKLYPIDIKNIIFASAFAGWAFAKLTHSNEV